MEIDKLASTATLTTTLVSGIRGSTAASHRKPPHRKPHRKKHSDANALRVGRSIRSSIAPATIALLLSAFTFVSSSVTNRVQAALPLFADGQQMPSLAPMLESVRRSVVNINTTGRVSTQQNPLLQDPFFRRFFDPDDVRPRQRESQSLGSGVIIDQEDGYVVTNAHVIENADEIKVTLQDGRTLDATLVGTDEEADIAVVKIDSRDIEAVPLGDSDVLRVGDYVVAIGNPFGIGQTVTSGIVSALGRSIGVESYENFIQTDASINPGNSGGALVNLRGELVGINTAILSRSGGNNGIGFAIPVNMMQGLVDQLVVHGKVRRGVLGVTIQDLTPDLSEWLNAGVYQGALVSSVLPGSPAEEAGLRDSDIIIEVNGRPVDSASSLRNLVGLIQPDSSVDITYVRDGRQRTVETTVRSRESIQLGSTSRVDPGRAQELANRLSGARFRDLDGGETANGRGGVLVVSVERGSQAAQSGLIEGDIIVSINKQTVTSMDSMRDAIGLGSNELLVQIQRGEGMLFIVVD